MARGEGAAVEDVDGNVYLDFSAGIAVAGDGPFAPRDRSGRNGPGLSIPAHLDRLSITSRRSRSARHSRRSRRSAANARTFFSNSGTEAVEAAIKLARYHTKRFNILAFLDPSMAARWDRWR
jgi:4-aminobutyrate aminotransferase